MLCITDHHVTANQSYNKISSHSTEMGTHQRTTSINMETRSQLEGVLSAPASLKSSTSIPKILVIEPPFDSTSWNIPPKAYQSIFHGKKQNEEKTFAPNVPCRTIHHSPTLETTQKTGQRHSGI